MAEPLYSSRLVAFEILQAVLRKRQAFDEVMERHPDLAKLEGRDRGFVHLLVATVLRRLGQIDGLLKACLTQETALKPMPHDLLRLGVAQLVFLGTPPHAAVDTMVELSRRDNATAPYKGLINAVLRRISREGAELVKTQDPVKLNIPYWLLDSWRIAYGETLARQIGRACLGEAQTDLSVKADPEEWAQKLGARLLPTGSLRLPDGTPITALEGFAEGAWWVQDAAAALPALLLGDVKGKVILDMCAAPGGKTAQLAARGADVIALDRAEKRLGRLRENLVRLNLNAEIFCGDASSFTPTRTIDGILLDAPCSATGTIRRHPDVLRLKGHEDVARLAELQRRILDHAVTLLPVGGVLVYAVCSLQQQETEAQIDALLARNAKVQRVPVLPEEIGGAAELITPKGDLRCFPHHWDSIGGLDGFYAARLKVTPTV